MTEKVKCPLLKLFFHNFDDMVPQEGIVTGNIYVIPKMILQQAQL